MYSMEYLGSDPAGATVGRLGTEEADAACPVTAADIQHWRDTVDGLLCAKDVTAPEYSLYLYVLDGGFSLVASYVVDTVGHTMTKDEAPLHVPEVIPISTAQEETCRQLFDVSCTS